MSLAADLEIPESGAVFTFGRSHFADNEPSHFFIKNDPVIDVACGDDHTAVICEQGRVFVFGANNHGQLGLGHTDSVQRPACLKWLKPRKARQVACGRSHTIILTEKREMFACGDNSEGQLGIGCSESQCVPQFIEIDGVEQVAAGAEHSVVVLNNGESYACGSNTEGQLGLGEGVRNATSFTKIPLDKHVKYAACGYYHTVLITAEGEAYIFGDNENQRLGVSDTSKHVSIPRLVSIQTPLKSIHCGHYHTFFVSRNGTIYALGSNERGQLGLPRSVIEVNNPTDISTEKLFDGHSIIKIACGALHTAFIADNGYLYTCGDATHQKLCLEEDSDFSNNNFNATPPNQYLPKRVDVLEGFDVINVACGGCHTILTAAKNGSVPDLPIDIPIAPVITELPPLQKVPVSISHLNEEHNANQVETKPEHPVSDENANTTKPDTDKLSVDSLEANKTSIDSLDANVSGSHILEINELRVSSMMSQLPDEQGNIEVVSSQIENLTEEVEKMEAPEVKEINTLQVPETLQQSPDMSTKSGLSQKTTKSSNGSQDSENETIICNSEKSSPQLTKAVQKTQAVIPILRNEEAIIPTIESKVADEVDVLHSKITKNVESEGKISKFFSGLRNESCIGKSRVISSVDIKDQIANEESTNVPAVADQTASKACIII